MSPTLSAVACDAPDVDDRPPAGPVPAISPAQQLRLRASALAEALVTLQYARRPALAERDGARGRGASLHEAALHIGCLADALDADSPALFMDYVGWAKVMLAQRGVHTDDVDFHLGCMAEVLRAELPRAVWAPAAALLGAARTRLPEMADEVDCFLDPPRPLSGLARRYLAALLRGERALAIREVLDAVAEGAAVKDVYLQVFQPVQYEIGRLWQTGRISVGQEHYCTAATQLAMSQLYGHVFATPRNGRVLVATCVSGDLHELGARMVSDLFELAGWDTFYTGANTPHDSVLRTVAERRADVLAVSATIGQHVPVVAELVAALREQPGGAAVKVLVGGLPFRLDPGLWRRVGADATADDAEQAVAVAGRLLGPARAAGAPAWT